VRMTTNVDTRGRVRQTIGSLLDKHGAASLSEVNWNLLFHSGCLIDYITQFDARSASIHSRARQ